MYTCEWAFGSALAVGRTYLIHATMRRYDAAGSWSTCAAGVELYVLTAVWLSQPVSVIHRAAGLTTCTLAVDH